MMSSCPYVVGVGGTANFNPERAGYEPSLPELYNGWSSGGFSRYFSTPSYQNASVTKYLAATNNSWSEYYNAKGRGFPDVAAYGQAINTVQKADDGVHMYLAGGTSASSPIFASVLALVNAKCKENGKGRVGWMQPTMYAAADAGNTGLNDITLGGSYWCGDYERAPGFSCEAGWDPATGLGTPYFQKLVEVFGCS
jgi:tripeptidyl-peptidase-1